MLNVIYDGFDKLLSLFKHVSYDSYTCHSHLLSEIHVSLSMEMFWF